MGRLSLLPTETTFAAGDYLVKVKSAGGGDVRVLQSDFVKAIGVPSLLRRAEMFKGADGAGGATLTQLEANDISFTGTPSQYGRLDIMVPMDYAAGTNATLKLLLYSASTNNQAVTYYVGAHASGATYSTWNVQSAVTTGSTLGLVANTLSTFSLYTISSANLAAGSKIAVAFRPASAITGTIVVIAGYLEYTSIL